ncbi:hypothetical protein [Desulfuromonas sp. AOP6]|uniref:hypothetical protein n=1 Tax=Desulfuromonas sp. AOP6 TaxID=1566351 RepID=UPI00127D40E4|nr:hypothetical protein [Desulfuromonas sp. AOP6]BCA78835.1 hypothetical protein AOP6_0622 [Desulfuromonas sp. AOP6]
MFLNFSALENPSQRERFSRLLAVIGIAVAFMGVLALFYPEQELLHLVRQDNTKGPATRVYLQALLRTRPQDHDLRLRLATQYMDMEQYRQALRVLDAAIGEVSVAERERYAELIVASLERLFALDQADAWRQRLQTLGRNIETTDPTGPDTYRRRAQSAFEQMRTAASLEQRRSLFFKAIRVLQEGNLLMEALAAADAHIGPLAGDRETLIFLSRLALAANRPDLAQVYIRRALGIPAQGGNP